MKKVCVICGKQFYAPPSSKKVTCSSACSSIQKSRSHLGKSNRWSEEAKERKRANGLPEALKKGTVAAKASPRSGRYVTNLNAKTWILIDPTGQEHTVRNLHLWARTHADLFGKPAGDAAAAQICSGFQAISRSLKGKRRNAMTYFGWTLKKPPI